MPPTQRSLPAVAVLGALVLLAVACAGPMPATDPPTPCDQTTDFAFLGRASQQQLGIGNAMDPMGAQVGTAWVTARPVDWGGGGGGGMALQARALCIAFDDGSGMGQSIEDDWQPPAGVFGPSGAEGAGSAPIGLLAALGMALLLVIVSLVAFGRDRAERPAV